MKEEKGLLPHQSHLNELFNTLTRLILPDPVPVEDAPTTEELKNSRKAVMCVLVDGKTVFGIPISTTKGDYEKLMSAVEEYHATIDNLH